MVATQSPGRGHDIIESLRRKHPEVTGAVGVVSSFCKGVTIKNVGGQAIVNATANTAEVDLEKEVVLPEGGDMASYFAKNKSVFLDHRYYSEFCVARMRNVALKSGGWYFSAGLVPNPKNEYVEHVRQMIEMPGGGIGCSIGFGMDEGGAPTAEEAKRYPGVEFVIRKWTCLEISYTAMPCNVSCRSMELTYGDEKAVAAKAMLTKARVPEKLWGTMGMVADPSPRRRKVFVLLGS